MNFKKIGHFKVFNMKFIFLGLLELFLLLKLSILLFTHMHKFLHPRSSFAEAHRALELLEDYHSRLGGPQDRALRIAIERVIRIFKSRLFQALLGK